MVGQRSVDDLGRLIGRGYDPDVCGAAAICAPIFTDGTIDPIINGNILR
jgi:hypothetical protein